MEEQIRDPILHASPVWLFKTQTWMHSMVTEQQRLGANVHVACERTENLDQFCVANLHSLSNEARWRQIVDKGIRRLQLRRHLHHLVRVGREIDARIVHSHFGIVGWANLGAMRKLGAKHTVTFYGLDVNKFPVRFPVWRKRYRQLFEEADLFFCEGTHMARCLIELGCPEKKIQVQHLGVNVERFEFKPRQWKPGEVLKVLIAASFREKKGICYGVEAVGRLSKAIPVELTIIGDAGAEAESRREKRKIVQALDRANLKSRVRLMGYQPYSVMMREAYAHHIFLQPSVTASDGDTEGGAPVSIIEMLASGMPVVSTAHCDIPEVMGKQLQHLLAPERDPMALENIMLSLIESSNNWPWIAVKGRERVAAEYDLRIQTERQLEHYARICANPK